jgi:hypothetical protein
VYCTRASPTERGIKIVTSSDNSIWVMRETYIFSALSGNFGLGTGWVRINPDPEGELVVFGHFGGAS